ncbi:MAG: multidrug efflux RND transporter permease subunit [Terrimicrobiaceae bacterium]|nr:multidrug efflux RND transporter permease subunit [Terrimicrobiaceae bacterium]
MKFSHFFIDRPIFAAVLSIVITLVGAISFQSLPIAQYPNVVPPTIVVTASYPGANPEVIADTVATPIEQEINGVENMLYMSSQATADGQLNITITFKLGTNLDTAQVLVQNRVAVAEPRLPEDVRRIGVKVDKSSPDLLLVAHLISPDNRYDQLYISNYAYLQVRDQLRRVDGVGQVNVFGGREYSMRIWLDPERLSNLNLTATDVVNALSEQNVQVAAGVIGQPPVPKGRAFQLTVTTLGRLKDPEQFADVVVKTGDNGRIVKVRDVARVELAALDYSVNSYLGGKPAVALAVQQRPGSNALATAEAVRRAIKDLSVNFPPGLEYRIIYDPTVFIQESVHAVVDTVFAAILLVVLVIMVFLQSWRASVIPLVAIPVSLIGTFAVMAALGFSLNNLTLFGLVLAIGIVVDDAIVVVENIERHIHEGMSPRDAAFKAMDEVGGPVISVALVLSAVFIPTAFVSGITGQFYKQFALTIAVSTVISAFVSLTLSPALGALLLRPREARCDWFTRIWNFLFGWFFNGFNRAFDWATRRYTADVGRVVRRAALALIVYAGLLGLAWFGFSQVPAGFIPAQDQGYAIVAIQLPDAAALERTDAVVKEVTRLAMETPGVLNAVAFAGFSGATRANASNAGAVFTPFKPFDERVKAGRSAVSIMADLRKKFAAIPDAVIVVIPPPPVRGLGTGGGFKLDVQDRGGAGLAALQQAADKLSAAARAEPGLIQVFSPFRVSTPQIYADIDRTKAKKLGVPLSEIFETLQVYLGSQFVNEFNLFGRTYRVTAQAEARFRDDPSAIANLKTRSKTGAIVPLGSLMEIKEKTGPDRVIRYNLYPAADISGDTVPGFSSGQAIEAIERLARENLPAGFAFEWTDLAYQQKLAGNTAIYIFPLCVLFVFLTLAAQYESWSLPLAIILIVPMCLLAGITGVWMRGLDNNILTQIGFIVLVGLSCKNAILIVEFARQIQVKEGKSRFDAAVEACRLRLRPILMTSFAFILGVLPLVLATGAGAEMRQALGTAVFSGMIGVTFFGLLLTPVFYVVIMGFADRRRNREVPPAGPLMHPAADRR